jgi:hypothetical protein
MTEEKAVALRQESALDVYGSGEDIKTLAKRIKVCLPGGNKLQEHDALALAQLSVAYGLNPFNGEVWLLVGKDGASRGTMVGIKGLRKAARKQGGYWPVFNVLNKAEKAELGIPETAVAYRCLVYRTDVLRQVAESIKMLHDGGMKDAFEIYAYKPAEGVGYCNPGEATKMKTDQAARKRSEADALKVAFDLPFATELTGGETVGYIDTEWEVLGTEPHLTGEPLQEKAKENIRVLRGDEKELGIGDDYAQPKGPDWGALGEAVETTDQIPPDLPHDALGFFAYVNKNVGNKYTTVRELLTALGRKSWPTDKEHDEWAECWKKATE